MTWDNKHSEAGRRANVHPASDPPIRLHGKGAVAIMAQPQPIVTPNFVPERFHQAYTDDPVTDCQLWQRAMNSRGYGVFYLEGKLHLAHRVAWLAAHGRWPVGNRVLDHICEIKRCVNPAHLREVTNFFNIRRAYPRGNAAIEHQRKLWRAASARRRSYSPEYVVEIEG